MKPLVQKQIVSAKSKMVLLPPGILNLLTTIEPGKSNVISRPYGSWPKSGASGWATRRRHSAATRTVRDNRGGGSEGCFSKVGRSWHEIDVDSFLWLLLPKIYGFEVLNIGILELLESMTKSIEETTKKPVVLGKIQMTLWKEAGDLSKNRWTPKEVGQLHQKKCLDETPMVVINYSTSPTDQQQKLCLLWRSSP